MVPKYIKKRREETFSECRQLLIKINGRIQKTYPESAFVGGASIQTLEDSLIYNSCDCCQSNDIPNEEITHIESGQRMCPACLRAFYTA